MRTPGPPRALARQPWKAFRSSPWKTRAEQLVPGLLRAGAAHPLCRAGPAPEGAFSGAAKLSTGEGRGESEVLRGLETRGTAPGLGAVEALGLLIDPDVEVEVAPRGLRGLGGPR